MATANDVITAAGRRAAILAGEEAMTAAELADGLTTLNDMMFGFRTQGIHYAHVALAAADTVNMPDELIDSLKWMMTDALVSDGYSVPLSPQQVTKITEARQALQAAYKYIPPAPSPRGLLRNRPGQFFNITRGE